MPETTAPQSNEVGLKERFFSYFQHEVTGISSPFVPVIPCATLFSFPSMHGNV
ncbi:hypothetical protein L228DRAFT_245511 [Xylona heveae TC161]|uniref:Uncharacterized protein n=1 Tax=Xylona heveae (strain CBS 132557 / TC161) TaxID=1328760 RepID=A0A165I8Q3_XYLHT|nr:hypothetical protein L228DRAFT_245511 [Xylona heveae TC161]KZF24548.1 hypothetical protein L228DRAFT_245511 [Xylona heveae TC161]